MNTQPILIPCARSELHADLTVPPDAHGCIVFAHGSGSSRHSPRNRFVAASLQQAGFATLLLDLLNDREEREEQAGARLRFDVEALATRLCIATDWIRDTPLTHALPLGYFGASTGAAAALIAAADRSSDVRAVVSRGGRPDLVPADQLARVVAPTLLLVGSEDEEVLALNRRALARMRGTHVLRIVQGASHLFEEPGTLAEVANHARAWFQRHIGKHRFATPMPTSERQPRD